MTISNAKYLLCEPSRGVKSMVFSREVWQKSFLNDFGIKADKTDFGNAELCASRLQNGLHGASPWPGSVQFEGSCDASLVLRLKICFSGVPGRLPGSQNEGDEVVSPSLCVPFCNFSDIGKVVKC